MTSLFFPYALNLSHLGTTVVLLVHVAFFFLVQVPGSRWWLSRYQFGPAEWLWRSLTYGKAQPMRLSQVDWQAKPILGSLDVTGGRSARVTV